MILVFGFKRKPDFVLTFTKGLGSRLTIIVSSFSPKSYTVSMGLLFKTYSTITGGLRKIREKISIITNDIMQLILILLVNLLLQKKRQKL